MKLKNTAGDFINFLGDENSRQLYAQKALEKAKDFDVENIANRWKRVLMEACNVR